MGGDSGCAPLGPPGMGSPVVAQVANLMSNSFTKGTGPNGLSGGASIEPSAIGEECVPPRPAEQPTAG
jgi:hypothetical protein